MGAVQIPAARFQYLVESFPKRRGCYSCRLMAIVLSHTQLAGSGVHILLTITLTFITVFWIRCMPNYRMTSTVSEPTSTEMLSRRIFPITEAECKYVVSSMQIGGAVERYGRCEHSPHPNRTSG